MASSVKPEPQQPGYSADNPFAPKPATGYSPDNPFAKAAAPASATAVAEPPVAAPTPTPAPAPLRLNPVVVRPTAADQASERYRLKYGHLPAQVATEVDAAGQPTGATVTTGRPVGVGVPKEEIDRMVGNPSFATRVRARIAAVHSPSGYSFEGPVPTFADLVTDAFMSEAARPIAGSAFDETDEKHMARFAAAGGQFDETKANVLGTSSAFGALVGNYLVNRALGGTGPRLTGTEAAKASLALPQATPAMRAGAVKAIEDIAAENQVHPSITAKLVEQTKRAFQARAPQLAEAAKSGAAQGIAGAGLGGVEAVASGEKRPSKIAQAMLQSGAVFAGLGAAFHALSAEAQFQLGYDAVSKSLEHAEQLRTGIASEKMAQAPGEPGAKYEGAEPASVVKWQPAGEYSPDNPFKPSRGKAPTDAELDRAPTLDEVTSAIADRRKELDRTPADHPERGALESRLRMLESQRRQLAGEPEPTVAKPKAASSDPAVRSFGEYVAQGYAPAVKPKVGAKVYDHRAQKPGVVSAVDDGGGIWVRHDGATADAFAGDEPLLTKQTRRLVKPTAAKTPKPPKEEPPRFSNLGVGELLRQLNEEQTRLEKESNAAGETWVASKDTPIAEGGSGALPSGKTMGAGRAKRQFGFTSARINELEARLRERGIHEEDILHARHGDNAEVEEAAAKHEESANADTSFDVGEFEAENNAPAAAEKPKHEYSSTQLDLPHETATAIKSLGAKIPDADLAGDGRETEPHITIKYGLHGSEPEKVRALLKDQPPIAVKLGKTSIFPADEKAVQRGGADVADVVKVDVDSPELHALNKKIADALPHTDTHPEYKPHATVAYVKPGLGKKYEGDDSLAGHALTVDKLTFSDQHGGKTVIPLGGTRASETATSDEKFEIPEDEKARAVANQSYREEYDARAAKALKEGRSIVSPDRIETFQRDVESVPSGTSDADIKKRADLFAKVYSYYLDRSKAPKHQKDYDWNGAIRDMAEAHQQAMDADPDRHGMYRIDGMIRVEDARKLVKKKLGSNVNPTALLERAHVHQIGGSSFRLADEHFKASGVSRFYDEVVVDHAIQAFRALPPDKQAGYLKPGKKPEHSPENPFAEHEGGTDLFGDAVAPKVEQTPLLGEHEGTQLARDEATKAKNYKKLISPKEMQQRRDELGAEEKAEQPPDTREAIDPEARLKELEPMIAQYESVNLNPKGRKKLERWKAEREQLEKELAPSQTRVDAIEAARTESELLRDAGRRAKKRVDEQLANNRGAGETAAPAEQPKVQRLIEDAGTRATPGDLEKLVDAASDPTKLPTSARDLREWAEKVIGRPFSSATWQMDDVYDAIEGAVNIKTRIEFGPMDWNANPIETLKKLRAIEESVFRGRLRSAGMMERQQFSTPLPIAYAAQFALSAQKGERILEPTAGTGNLVNFLRQSGVQVHVNEIDPRRAEILKLLDFKPTTEDALTLPLTGERVNAVVMNPPFGAYSTGKYAGQGALPFAGKNVAERFVYAAIQMLVDGGRVVAVMPHGVMGESPFRRWLEANHSLVALIDSPPGAYTGRGTDYGTTLLVADKGKLDQPEKPYIVKFDEKDMEVVGNADRAWMNWYLAVRTFQPSQHSGLPIDNQRMTGHEPAKDVAATRVRPVTEKTETSARPEAKLVEPSPSSHIPEQAPTAPSGVEQRLDKVTQQLGLLIDAVKENSNVGSARESGSATGGGLAARPGEAPAERGPAAGQRGVRPGEPANGPGAGAGPGRERNSDVVAEQPPGLSGRQDAESGGAGGLVRPVSRGGTESAAVNLAQRQRELEAAAHSGVFTPYRVGLRASRTPHPRVVVETRSMAGMPAPPITAQSKSPYVDAAWGRSGATGGISDEQMDAIMRGVTAWENGHGFLIADDVGVGKTREGAGLILEAIARGAKRILYTTKNEVNMLDAQNELRLVASGSENGEFPAQFITVGDYKDVKKGTESLPRPNQPTVYFAHSYNFKDFAEALRDTGIDTWLADEAHEFKNLFADRGMAWVEQHRQILQRPDGRIAYLTATPAVTLDELGYLFGLREWPVGGFKDWVARKLGKELDEKDEKASDDVIEQAKDEARELGDRDLDTLSDDDKKVAAGKKKFMRGGADIFAMKVTPAETEQVMREMKGSGKYISRDLWRGGVKFNVQHVDLLGDTPKAVAARARYDAAADLSRDISLASRKFGRMNAKVKAVGLERALIQSYLKQLLFDLRFPDVLRLADAALKDGKQVVISVHSVAGDADLMEGMSAADAEVPLNKRLESAINRINTRNVEKEGQGEDAVYTDLGEIPEALMAVAALRERLAKLEPLRDPIRTLEDHFGQNKLASITGKVSAKRRKTLMAEFQSGQRQVAVISKAGKVGISLHDVNGRERKMIVADYEWSADTFKQELGRVDRTGQRSSPDISLVASNIAGEKKFAATIAARMASLGATSKGSAESTGTDALDQFDVADGISLTAMKNAVSQFDDRLRGLFTGSKFTELGRNRETNEWESFPKRRPDDVGIRDFLLEIMMFPVKSADLAWQQWSAERDKLMNGDEQMAKEMKRTGRLKGDVLRTMDLQTAGDPTLTMVDVKNEDGEHKSILQGYVTHYINKIQGVRGLDENGNAKSRRYVQFTTKDGNLVSGLEVGPLDARKLREYFGKGERTTITPKEAWQDLQAGEDVTINGPDNQKWTLHLRRDDKVAIQGATLAKHAKVLNGYAGFSPVGNFMFIKNDEADFNKLVERFPLKQPKGKPAAGGGGTQLYGVADPVTALALQFKEAWERYRAERGLPKTPEPLAIAAGKVAEVGKSLRNIFDASSASPEAGQVSRIIRQHRGEMDREYERARETLLNLRQSVQELPAGDLFDGERWQWYADLERGVESNDPRLAAAGRVLHKIQDDVRDQVHALGPGHLDNFIDNYMARVYVPLSEEQKRRALARYGGKRPLSGPKGFKRLRKHLTLGESLHAALALGLGPPSDNPLDMVALKLREMRRYIMAHRIFQEGRKEGLLKFKKASRSLPEGYAKINDSMATVFAPRGAEGETRIRGEYVAPTDVARVINNFLSPGLRGNAIYDAYSWTGNIMNMVQLGLSAFHAGFVAFDATIQMGAVGLDQLLSGRGPGGRLAGAKKIGIAAASAATGAVTFLPLPAAIQSYLRGREVWRAYMNDAATEEMRQLIDALVAGGGRAKMDDFYRAGNMAAMRQAFRDKRWLKTVLHLPFAAIEAVMYPLLEHVVPRMKLGAIDMMMPVELAKLQPGSTQDEYRTVTARVIDAVDARLGQMIYDNRFWHRTTKEMMMAGVRSVGWNVGNMDVTVGGAAQAVHNVRQFGAGKTPESWHKVYYLATLAGLVALWGAVYTYLHTGHGPESWKDYYFPPNGKVDDAGNAERMQPATYMKDIFSMARHPLRTLGHKTHPLINEVIDILANKDFYGDKIRNPDDPAVVQARQVYDHVKESFKPFTFRNMAEASKRGEGFVEKAQGFVGTQVAPREIERTPAQNKMAEYLADRREVGGRTPEQKAQSQQRQLVRQQLRVARQQGDTAGAREAREKTRALEVAGEMTHRQATQLVKSVRVNPLVADFKQLTFDQATKVYELANDHERQLWYSLLRTKAARAGRIQDFRKLNIERPTSTNRLVMP